MSDEEDEQPSRSERLRERRSQRSEASETDELSETSDTSQTSKPSETEKTKAVKDERVGVYMYLTEEQKRNLERLYNTLKAEYEFEFDDFEKNRHFYPILIQNGLDSLDGLDAQDVREMLDDM